MAKLRQSAGEGFKSLGYCSLMPPWLPAPDQCQGRRPLRGPSSLQGEQEVLQGPLLLQDLQQSFDK